MRAAFPFTLALALTAPAAARADEAPAGRPANLTSVRIILPLSQFAFTTIAEADNQAQIAIGGLVLTHQHGRAVFEASSVVNLLSEGAPADFGVRAGIAFARHDGRTADEGGAPRGWLVQGEALAGYRYLNVGPYPAPLRLTILGVLDATYFAGGDRLGVGFRIGVGGSWAPGDPPAYRWFNDLSLAVGVTF